jgi:hypothetical protein
LKDPSKAWIGNDHPCEEADMDLFYAAPPSPSTMGVLQAFGIRLVFKGETKGHCAIYLCNL